jgi:protein MpaA
VLLLPLSAPSAPGAGRDWRRFENRVLGHTVRVPPGWKATVRDDGVTLLTGRGGYLWVFDYGGVAGPLRSRLERLSLGPKAVHGCGFGEGWMFHFRDRGRTLQAFIRDGDGARAALAALQTLRLTRRAEEVANERSRLLLGRSHEGRAIRAWRVGNPRSPRKLLVVGCIHGTECAGMAVTQRLLDLTRPTPADIWVVQNLNPDGLAHGVRQNARGVDLNRNFPSQWKPIGRRWDPQYSGPGPLSERETRIAVNLVRRVRPDVSIWFHQPQALVRAWGPSIPVARRYAYLAEELYRSLPWPNGTAPNWQNHRFPGAASFVVELPAGRLSGGAAERHLNAIIGLAE